MCGVEISISHALLRSTNTCVGVRVISSPKGVANHIYIWYGRRPRNPPNKPAIPACPSFKFTSSALSQVEPPNKAPHEGFQQRPDPPNVPSVNPTSPLRQ